MKLIQSILKFTKSIILYFQAYLQIKNYLKFLNIISILGFFGVQFHPELISRPLNPHPIFVNFVRAAMNKSKLLK